MAHAGSIPAPLLPGFTWWANPGIEEELIVKSRKGVILSIVVVALALCCVVPASAATSTHQPTAATVSVDITRDSYGVPHIYSTSEVGLFYGYGYVAALYRPRSPGHTLAPMQPGPDRTAHGLLWAS